MNRKGEILALALTLALSVTSTLMVGCYEGQTGSTEKTSSITLDRRTLAWMRAEANNFRRVVQK